jgi:hypothetical protein
MIGSLKFVEKKALRREPFVPRTILIEACADPDQRALTALTRLTNRAPRGKGWSCADLIVRIDVGREKPEPHRKNEGAHSSASAADS